LAKKNVRYWIKDVSGAIGKTTENSAELWCKGKGWVEWESYNDVHQGRNCDWSPIVREEDGLARIKEIEEKGYDAPFERPETFY